MPVLKRRWTVADLRELPDDGNRYEVIDGELFVTPAPTFRHQRAVGLLYRLLCDYLAIERVGHALFAPADVTFSEERGLQPDLFVTPLVDGRPPERFEDAGRLLLAAEVLSPSTARADRVKKRRIYREEGVTEYWIVDLDARVFDRTSPIDGRVEVLDATIQWHPERAAMPLSIDVAEYFRQVLDG